MKIDEIGAAVEKLIDSDVLLARRFEILHTRHFENYRLRLAQPALSFAKWQDATSDPRPGWRRLKARLMRVTL